MGAAKDRSTSSGDRAGEAAIFVQRGIAVAEEKYLIHRGATLGTWFARVQETIAVASRVTVARIEEARWPLEDTVVAEQLGVQVDICAEAVRATAQVWGGGSSPAAKAEILDLLSARPAQIRHATWGALLVSLARCSAALEPLAGGLRDADLPMGEPTDGEVVADCFLGVARNAFGAVHAIC